MTVPNYPSPEVKAFGERVNVAMYAASVRKSAAGLGGCKAYDPADFDEDVLPYINAYLEGNLDSVAITYAAMRTKELDIIAREAEVNTRCDAIRDAHNNLYGPAPEVVDCHATGVCVQSGLRAEKPASVTWQNKFKPFELVAPEDWDNIDPQWRWMYRPLKPYRIDDDAENRKLFAAFVKKNLGDIAVMDNGRYISPKINNYWLLWEESRQQYSESPVNQKPSVTEEQFERAQKAAMGTPSPVQPAPVQPVAVFGYCPICGAEGVMREKQPNGYDKCAKGHTYPSSKASPVQPAMTQKWSVSQDPLTQLQLAQIIAERDSTPSKNGEPS
jgi:hypothetical protein